jgi:hypothetical protein
MEDSKVQVSKLKLKLGGSDELELTVEQARKLKAALEDLFGRTEVRVEKEFIYWPAAPYKYDRRPWGQEFWYCSGSNDGAAAYLSVDLKETR